MKLLFDENLSRRLPSMLTVLYPKSSHIREMAVGRPSDAEIWEHAQNLDYMIVSKDRDFARRSARDQNAPKIIWLRFGNCTTESVIEALTAHHDQIARFSKQNGEKCLELGFGPRLVKPK